MSLITSAIRALYPLAKFAPPSLVTLHFPQLPEYYHDCILMDGFIGRAGWVDKMEGSADYFHGWEGFFEDNTKSIENIRWIEAGYLFIGSGCSWDVLIDCNKEPSKLRILHSESRFREYLPVEATVAKLDITVQDYIVNILSVDRYDEDRNLSYKVANTWPAKM